MVPVSILIPARNAAQTIAATIRSAIAQAPQEIIVFDDGSTDHTIQVCQSMHLPVIQSGHNGFARASNILAATAKAPYLKFLDADDYLLPGALKQEVDAIQEGDSVLFSDYMLLKYLSPYDELADLRYIHTNPSLIHGLVSHQFPPPTGSFLFRKSLFDTIQWREDVMITGHYDRWLSLEICQNRLQSRYNPQPVYVHRCGWSLSQLSQRPDYAEARINFLQALYQWMDALPDDDPAILGVGGREQYLSLKEMTLLRTVRDDRALSQC